MYSIFYVMKHIFCLRCLYNIYGWSLQCQHLVTEVRGLQGAFLFLGLINLEVPKNSCGIIRHFGPWNHTEIIHFVWWDSARCQAIYHVIFLFNSRVCCSVIPYLSYMNSYDHIREMYLLWQECIHSLHQKCIFFHQMWYNVHRHTLYRSRGINLCCTAISCPCMCCVQRR